MTRSAAEVAEHFGLSAAPEWAPRFNLAPTQEAPVVRTRSTGERVAELRRWGLVPRWAKDVSVGARMINARAESVAERPAFREALKRRRCLVPADGFYEWQGRAGHRRPHHITLPEGELFAIAGLYENWLGAGGEAVETFTLMTQAATGAVAALHGRMPLILDPADYAGWLERGELAPDAIASFSQTRAGALVTRPVDTRVNDVRNDDPECLAPPAEPELPLFSS